MNSPRALTAVVIGGTARSGNSLLGNILGTWQEALYLPVEIKLSKLFGAAVVDRPGRIRTYIDRVADQLGRGKFGPSSLGEVHEVRGFQADMFRKSFAENPDHAMSPASLVDAFVQAMRVCREEGESACIGVVEAPGSEFLFGELVRSREEVRCIQIIRPLLDVYASAKAKYLRTYYPSLRHPENLLRQIVMQWRWSIRQAGVNLVTIGGDRVQVVDFTTAKAFGEAFRTQLAGFIFPSMTRERARLRAHLDAVGAAEDPLRGRFVVTENRSPIPRGNASRYAHLAGWEVALCRLYDSLFQSARRLAGQALDGTATGLSSGMPLLAELAGLIVRAAIAGPRLDRQFLHFRHGLRLRRLAVETALDTARWRTEAASCRC